MIDHVIIINFYEYKTLYPMCRLLTFSPYFNLRSRSIEGKELFIDLICKSFVEISLPEDDINKPTMMSNYPPKTIEVII